jgi:hypothetical protein
VPELCSENASEMLGAARFRKWSVLLALGPAAEEATKQVRRVVLSVHANPQRSPPPPEPY